MNINSNRSESFIREGKSTMLGLFQIKKLKIYQSNRVSIQRGEYTIKDTVLKEILVTEFDSLYVDLIDFDFDTEKGYYSKVISSEDLADASKKDLDASVFSWDDYMSLMTTGFSIQWFENITNLIFEWTISNGDEMESVYTFETPSTFDCAKTVPGCSESLKLEKEWRREEADTHMHTNASSTTITGKATNDELSTSEKIDEMISEIVNQRVDQALAASRHSDTSVKSSNDVDEIIAMVNSTLQFQPEITEPTFAPPSYGESEGRFFRELQEDKEGA